jgi:hypothetical protein
MNSKRIIGDARALALLLAVACSSRNAPVLPALRNLSLAPATKGAAVVYVSDPTANAVNVYSATGHNQSPMATIKNGIGGPAGLATDNSGNLYVANTAGNTVTEYAPKSSSPAATYSTGLLGPVDVAVGDDGNVYVANFYSFAASVVEFTSGNQKPSLTIVDPCGCWPIGLALDGQANLYVAYEYYSQTFVYEYAKGSTKGVALNYQFGQANWEVAGLLLDKASNLLAADANLPGVKVFPAGSGHSSHAFGKRGSPRFIAFDTGERNVFVTDTARHAVEEYAYPSGRLKNVITNGLNGVYGVAVSPRAPL